MTASTKGPAYQEMLADVAEYFANRQDADHNGETFTPNTEMRLLQDVLSAEVLMGEMYEALKAILPLCEEAMSAPRYRSDAQKAALEAGYLAIRKADGK